MFTYRCPACGKQHSSETDFHEPFATRCLRCGDAFDVNEALVHGVPVPVSAGVSTMGLEKAITAHRPRASVDDNNAGANSSDVLEAIAIQGEVESEPISRRKRVHRRRPVQRGAAESNEHAAYEDSTERFGEDHEMPAANSRRQWALALIAGISAVVLLIGSLGAYFLISRNTPSPASEKMAKSGRKTGNGDAPGPTDKEVASKEVPAKEAGSEPAAAILEASGKPKTSRIIHLSAARLSAELAADADGTNRKYEKAVVEVSGPFEKVESKKPDQATTSYVLFAGNNPRVSCDLTESATPLGSWQSLLRGQPISVRGDCEKDGVVQFCELAPLVAPAEDKYKNKEVELVGYADEIFRVGPQEPFPTIVLEPETDSRVGVDCLFRKIDEENVAKIQPGAPLIISGVCNGRRRVGDKFRVRLDNCQLVATTAPAASTPRLPVAQFLREYGEDLQADLRPEIGAETVVESPISLARLARERVIDPAALDKTYRHKIVIVSGRVASKVSPHMMILESEDTDVVIKVECRFSRRRFQEVDDARQQNVRGVWSGVLNGTLRLDNCELADVATAGDARRLSADFLPHTPKRSLVYDFAAFPIVGDAAPTVVRQVCLQRDGGTIETSITHSGKLAGKSLFDQGEQARWPAQRRTKKVRLPGPVYERRVSAGFVEIGHHVPAKGTGMETAWEPALKLRAKAGDSWTWNYANERHRYTVGDFQDENGRVSVTITEMVVRDEDRDHPSEIRHVYVRGLGEVERRELQWITSKNKRTVNEMKLVDDADLAPATADKTPNSKTLPPERDK